MRRILAVFMMMAVFMVAMAAPSALAQGPQYCWDDPFSGQRCFSTPPECAKDVQNRIVQAGEEPPDCYQQWPQGLVCQSANDTRCSTI